MIFLWFQFDFHYDQIYDLKTIYVFFRLSLQFFMNKFMLKFMNKFMNFLILVAQKKS